MLLLCVVLGSLAAGAGDAGAQCFLSYVWTASEDDAILRRVALDGLTVEETVSISVPGQIVTGVTGISVDPVTGDLFILAYFGGAPGAAPFLMRYDPINQFTTVLGNTFVDFTALAFHDNGELYAVSADTASPPDSLCTLSLVTGAPLDVCLYGDGDDGEAIAWDPLDDLLYHASGANTLVFQGQAPGGIDPCDTNDIALSGAPLTGSAVTGIVWWPSESAFLWAQAGPSSALYRVTESGVATALGSLGHSVSDIAIVEVPTPCPPGDDFIRGDCNADNTFNIADAVFALGVLFPAPPNPPNVPQCMDACDANDDGVLNIADPIAKLGVLFPSTTPPPTLPLPYPGCGPDPGPVILGCGAHPCP
jgi:hypothetical protein